ncbi:amidinotransferase [Salinivibrio sp. ML198]|uniref:arginine deiminase-related protein n=1 Tax=Salinivibrio sp. ML198 TaxID=1909458 RepID=UPI0009893D68|nr:arginine deiminase-related protein [Salinivibrio sp. ML198]OOE79205.1 amidinotransferase [Salinivibrio sp. ML198]
MAFLASCDTQYPLTHPHAASAVVMVPPLHFKFNAQTSEDNGFQHAPSLPDEEVKTRAMAEFNNMVMILRRHGIDVVVMEYPESDPATPDAVFPNNWFSTLPSGELYLYPMACPNRQLEVKPERLMAALDRAGYAVNHVHKVKCHDKDDAFLESTGAMVIDHLNQRVYAALSHRCDSILLTEWAAKVGMRQVVSFNTEMSDGNPVYHTNVMMAVGEEFAVVCDEVIEAGQRDLVCNTLSQDKTLVFISESQMNQLCGNILQLRNRHGESLIVMPLSAYSAFTEEQKRTLRQFGKLVPIDVNTIETVGGGSVRCMMGEVFLPRHQAAISG